MHSCFLLITNIQKNAVIFLYFQKELAVWCTDLLYMYTEELQELYLNFCPSSLYLSWHQLLHAVGACDVLLSWDRQTECLACGHTGGIPTPVFPVLSCSSCLWDWQGRNYVPCFLGSSTSLCVELRGKKVSSPVPCISYSKDKGQLQVPERGVNNNLN